MITVLFDNNAYRYLSRDESDVPHLVDRIRATEASHGIQARVCPIVLQELLASAGGPNDDGRRYACAAVSAMLRHCRNSAGDLEHFADPESVICGVLFGEVPTGKIVSIQELGSLAQRLISRSNDISCADEMTLQGIRAHVDRREQDFVNDTIAGLSSVVGGRAVALPALRNDRARRLEFAKHLRSHDGQLLHARGVVERAARQMRRTLSQQEVARCSSIIRSLFPVAVSLGVTVIDRVLMNGCNLRIKNRANWIWDIHILFCAPARPDDDGHEVRVVTADRAMLDAARSEGSRVVVSYDAYVNDPSIVC